MRLRSRKQPKWKIYNSGGYGNLREPEPQPQPQQVVEIPQLLQHIVRNLGGRNLCFVVQKELTKSDLDTGLSRLLMLNMSELENRDDVLSNEEKEVLKTDTNDGFKKNFMAVKVRDLQGEWRTLSIRLWNKNRYLILTTKWNDIVASYNFKAGDVIRVWCFRTLPKNDNGDQRQTTLHFVIVNDVMLQEH